MMESLTSIHRGRSGHHFDLLRQSRGEAVITPVWNFSTTAWSN